MDPQSRQYTYIHDQRVLPPGTRATTHCGINQLGPVRLALGRYNMLQSFLSSPLGHFLQIPLSLQMSAPQLIYQVLLREVTFPEAREDEMWFEIGGELYRYGKQEFILISGLRFGPINKKSLEARPVGDDSLRTRLFPHQNLVSGQDINAVLTRENLAADDVLKLGYIAVVNMILLGHDERKNVPDMLWNMIEDLEAFQAFPWGTYIYSQSLYFLRLATKVDKRSGKIGKKVNIYGFVWAFQVHSVTYYSI